jgi:Protein of unknown function (DUF2971)
MTNGFLPETFVTHANQPPPEILHHYTTQQGLIGIVGSAKLWATKVQYLNDSTELSLAIGLAQERIGRLIPNADAAHGPALERMSKLEGVAQVNIFVACFCEYGDLLSQWRGYSGASHGFSIGLRSAGLQGAAGPHRFTLGRCIYDRAKQIKIIDEAIDHCLGLAVGTTGSAVAFERLLLAVGAYFKDPGFHEENEWRLVSTPIDIRDERVAFRPGKSMLTPYFNIPLGELPAVIHGIVVGPCPHPALSMSSARMLLIQAGLSTSPLWGKGHKANVCASTIPYRDW